MFGGDEVGQYFSNEQLESHLQKYDTVVRGTSFSFYTDKGVFCKDHLDFGTKLLLEHLPLCDIEGAILDVGCGYGVMGIVLSKLTGSIATMVDVNRRALHLARRNAKENGVGSFEVLESDGYQNVAGTFQTIVTNPPIRAGKEVVYRILLGAKDHLTTGGNLYFVIRKEQGAKSLISDMAKCYTVTILEKDRGYFVVKCTFPVDILK